MTVRTYVMGGAANQLFQFATGLALARKLGVPLEIDNSRYDCSNEWRMYSLGLFRGITEPVVKTPHPIVIREQGLPYNPQIFDGAPYNVSIYGYWQCFRYFEELREELMERLIPREPIPRDSNDTLTRILAEGDKSCFVTVRRTDYVGNSFHGLLPMEYYRQAADLIASRVPDPCFFVFSDDPEWCVENFKLPYRTMIAGNFYRTVKPHLGREDAELLLMWNCRHAICANSSYSAWGAWLGKAHYGGITIAPKNWFGPAADADARDICPDRWIRI